VGFAAYDGNLCSVVAGDVGVVGIAVEKTSRLARIFGEEQRYYAENGKYASSLAPIFDEAQKYDGQRNFYMIGIPDACSPSGHAEENITAFRFYGMYQERQDEVRDYFRSVKEEDCRSAQGGYRIFAAAKIRKNPESLDVWTIDQNKVLLNIRWGAQDKFVHSRFFEALWKFFSSH
jgi:hypothetical protein